MSLNSSALAGVESESISWREEQDLFQKRSTAIQILHCIFKYRRTLLPSKVDGVLFMSSHLHKIEAFVESQSPIHLILPAFPAKSPNTQKVIGKLADMGERVSILFLQSLCDQIQKLYAPGARLTICSDGRVFSDLVHVCDADISAYGKSLRSILSEEKARSLSIFNMEDVFTGSDFPEMRKSLESQYARSVDTVREEIRTDYNSRTLFNGIHRFLIEDYTVLFPEKSRNKIRKECKKAAYGLIQRSNAWSDLISIRFPYSLRLSIHPHAVDSEKIGIHMIPTKDAWGTPWHNVAAYNGKDFCLMKRSEAESLGGVLQYRDGQPSHYLI